MGLACVATAAMSLVSIGSEVRAELASVVIKESSEILASDNWACAKEPWPYGCQWRGPSIKRVITRGPRPI
jgi:hypothetical protein